MRTSRQAANDIVNEAKRAGYIAQPHDETGEAFAAWLAPKLKGFAREVLAECEGKLGEVRTTLKYEPEDVT